jgi:gliding motility-associated-like protein
VTNKVSITGTPGQLFLPNAFIPGSATTELRVFMAKGSGIKNWLMQIFNNYGQLIFQTTRLDSKGAPVDGWDGTFKGAPMPQGSYTWQVSATFINGTQWKGMSYNGGLPQRTGSVNLIR